MERLVGNLILILISSALVTAVYIPPGPKYTCPLISANLFPCKCNKGSDVGIYVSCDSGNLASLSVAFQNLASLNSSKIEEITLTNSNIGVLYGTILHRSNARVLKIENAPIKSINSFIFHGINITLEELYLRNTSLTEFPRDAAKILGNLKILEIDRHLITKLINSEFDESQITGKLEKLMITNGLLSDMAPNVFQQLKKLKILDLHGNQLEVLKKSQFKGLRDTEALDISYNKIIKLDSSHIADLTKMSFCNASHNQLNELTKGAFARNAVLRVLNLSFNNIKRLDANSLRGMRFLRRLYLSNNAITDIGRGTFGSVNRIGTIDLARNEIKKIDFQMFSQLNYVEEIDVSENNITEIQKQSFTDLYLTNINISFNMLSKIEVGSFMNCANITKLDMSHNLIESIPRLAFDSTTYSSDLDLSYNRLTNMSQIPLQNMTGLRVLNVSFNQLTDIPKNTFPKLYELHTIDVSHNMIELISNAVFMPLFSLRNLNLSYNSLENIKPSTFGSLSTLLELDLSNNKLKEVSRGSLAKLSSVRNLNVENNHLEIIFQLPISLNYLYFRNNSLKAIPEKTWPVMNALLFLDLGSNQIENNLRGDSFLGLLTLQTLYLDNNGISKIPFQSLNELKTLQYVHLEHNNITELSKNAFGKLPVVFEVNLYNNKISNISGKAFNGLLQLLTLNISRNALKSIPPDAFFGLVSLQKIDLSHNFLEKLDNKTNSIFEECLSLREINLSNNKISFITRKMFPSNIYVPYRLEKVDLSHNLIPVLTFDITFGTRKLKHLNLSHNAINDIRKFSLGNITALEVLDLSSNNLKDLDSTDNPFKLPTNLTHLYLQNNQIYNLAFEEITSLKNLREVHLENNLLTYLNKSLIDSIKNGVSVFYKGNPISCTCEIRPLYHYLQLQANPPSQYADIICNQPKQVAEKTIIQLEDEQLTCSPIEIESIKNYTYEYDALPNLRFRDILYTKKSLIIQFYVSTITKDIADFYMYLKNGDNKNLLAKILAYDTRITSIASSELDAINFDENIQLCILAKNSDGIVLGLRESQCIKMPINFNAVMKKFNKRPATFFKIFEQDRKNIGKNSIVLSAGSTLFINSILTAIITLRLIYLFI